MFMMEYHYGKLFEAMGNDNAALQKYITLTNTLEEDASSVYVLQSMVNLYFKQKQWVQVQKYCDRAMKLAERFQMNYIYIQLVIVRANVLRIRQDNVGYEKELKKALTLAKAASLSKLIKEIAHKLGDYYMEQRFYKKSSEYYKMALLATK